MRYLYAFSLAWALCTRVPLPRRCFPPDADPRLQSLSVMFYPGVGIVLGMILLLAYVLLASTGSTFVIAALLVSAWAGLTGAMHLDGLADSVDAYFAAHKGDVFVLKVFKDPHCGPMAVVAVVLVLLLKFAALVTLIEQQRLVLPLLVALCVSRALVFPFMAFTPYLRAQGLASDMALTGYRKGWLISAVTVLLICTTVFPVVFLWVVPAVGLTLYWRHIGMKTMGGFVGDCVGALIEMVEVVILVMAVMLCF